MQWLCASIYSMCSQYNKGFSLTGTPALLACCIVSGMERHRALSRSAATLLAMVAALDCRVFNVQTASWKTTTKGQNCNYFKVEIAAKYIIEEGRERKPKKKRRRGGIYQTGTHECMTKHNIYQWVKIAELLNFVDSGLNFFIGCYNSNWEE